ncbi:RNA polymerase sigma-70 factor [Puteibacter caeruleilacunae]|nr:RNA polymerase sigma-70 factor [Puteibacter caeruleilacunae]
MKEAILIKDIHSGDRQAFKQIFNLFYARMVAFGKKFIQSQQDAEDITQEAFLILWEKKKDFDTLESIKAFLYLTIRNKALNIIKHHKIEQDFESQDKLSKEGEVFYMNSLIQEETKALFYEALSKLPEKTQQVIRLSMEGLKNPEIAEQLDISVNTVKFHKSNAFKTLREQLKENIYILLPFINLFI